jgi:hypothetical protein
MRQAGLNKRMFLTFGQSHRLGYKAQLLFVLNEFAPVPSIEGDSKRRWNCLDNSPLVKSDVTLFSISK